MTVNPFHEAKPKQPEPAERILEAAEYLFAQKGYSAVGVRELAAVADVNIAMISYYFGSKRRLLQQLIDKFFRLYKSTLDEIFSLELASEEFVRELVKQVITLFKKHHQLVRIAMAELPLDVILSGQNRIDKMKQFYQTITKPVCDKNSLEESDPQTVIIKGTALLSLLTSFFLMKPILEETNLVQLDEVFYEKLPQVISDMIISGLLENRKHPDPILAETMAQPLHTSNA
jgi:AcrR family transcriptional regulator